MYRIQETADGINISGKFIGVSVSGKVKNEDSLTAELAFKGSDVNLRIKINGDFALLSGKGIDVICKNSDILRELSGYLDAKSYQVVTRVIGTLDSYIVGTELG